MRKFLTVLAMFLFAFSDGVFAQCPDPQVPSFITHAEIALKGVNLNANVQAGVWTRFGGFAAGFVSHAVPYKEQTKNNYSDLAPSTRQVITPVGTLSGRIVLAYKYLVSPYITAGKGYTEKGVRLGVLTENDMAIGLKASDQGFGICLARIF